MVLTGAGVSAESGLPTFRGGGGLWEGFRVEDVATPEAFARDPALVRRFYDARRRALQGPDVRPNAAHVALARLERELPGGALIVTQNVDDLHERAGARAVVHMHGELLRALCAACGRSAPWRGDLGAEAACPACGLVGRMRPDVVWFGEVPYRMGEIEAALGACRLFVAAGTSGLVHPAAGFAARARAAGARTLEVNPEPSPSPAFDERRRGPAGRLVPALVDELLRRPP